MGQYTKKGLLNGYKKNNKERESLDYYATPPREVLNILQQLNYNFDEKTILEPCAGGGHMLKGILDYCDLKNQKPLKIIATEYKERPNITEKEIIYNLDFLDDNYPIDIADIIVMNPPYATIEPFLIRALEIYEDKLIVLCRLQVLEGLSRYKNIFSTNPPQFIYQYVDRIQCWKGGKESTGSSAQAYCWLIWDRNAENKEPILRWIRRK